MLARYRILRGKRPAGDPLPSGRRLDIRKHHRHVLSPDPEMVHRYLADPSEDAFARFARDYQALLEGRFAAERAPFDALASEARLGDVHLGCSCPTKANPRVERCHTVVALRFMKERYPDLEVVFPETSAAT